MALRFTAAFFSALLFINCENKRGDRESTANDTQASVQLDSTKKIPQDSIDENFACVRGPAKSVVKKEVFPNAVFKLNDDKRTGVEALDLKNSDKLIIHNWGCEYYVLTFRFETARFKADTTDINYWMEKASLLMDEIKEGLDSPLDISRGTLAIKNLLKVNHEYLLGQEIVTRSGDIRSFVTFDRIQKISEKKFAIEVSFATGPL